MIKFGADIILKSDGAAITDADIDALIRKGNQRASEIDARIKADCKHSLADFTVRKAAGDSQGALTSSDAFCGAQCPPSCEPFRPSVKPPTAQL